MGAYKYTGNYRLILCHSVGVDICYEGLVTLSYIFSVWPLWHVFGNKAIVT
jgi:hypothetical protein